VNDHQENDMSEATQRASQMPAIAKAAMRFQVFLLRHNLMGPLGDEILAITVKGRKSGKAYSTPIGYLRDGETIIALSRGTHWFKNAIAAGEVTLEIRGKSFKVHAEAITDQVERERIFDLYKRDRARFFSRLFGVPVTAPADQLKSALATRDFVKFHSIR
jgi:deazaflavin-dependent oxidoreductase (nitroreductase family)